MVIDVGFALSTEEVVATWLLGQKRLFATPLLFGESSRVDVNDRSALS